MTEQNITHSTTETMDDYKDLLEKSYTKASLGELLTGTIVGISDDELAIDLNLYCDGIIPANELSQDPKQTAHTFTVGETITAVVTNLDNGQGQLVLSKKQADDITAWDKFKELQNNDTVFDLTVDGIVNSGVITYVEGVRGFIPASHLSLEYVEDLNPWLHKSIKAKVLSVDANKKRLLLSCKLVLQAEAREKVANQIKQISVGDVLSGTVDKITTYGAFIKVSDDISGLVHISQIAHKRLKSVYEVLKENDTVTVKVIEIKDGKLSLSIKALLENEEAMPEEVFDYKEEGEATTTLGNLFAHIKLD